MQASRDALMSFFSVSTALQSQVELVWHSPTQSSPIMLHILDKARRHGWGVVDAAAMTGHGAMTSGRKWLCLRADLAVVEPY